MLFRRKSALWRALLLAVAVGVLPVASMRAHAQAADLQTLNEQILENPQDVGLNLAYAHAAEAEGKLRLALAAYERVLINDPDNLDAQHGFERIRRIIEPAYSAIRVEFGESWDSNALDLSDHAEDAYTTFANATWVDERRIGARRWRTYANFQAELTPEIDELNYGYLGVQTGPFVDLTPTAAAIPSVGAAVSTFSNEFYFGEVNASVTVEGHRDGATYWSRLRAGWRDYGENSTAKQGPYAELMGGVSVPSVASSNDWVVAVPWVRWSGINGSAENFLNDPVAPGRYAEVGIDASYNYRINDRFSVAVGAMARDRRYTETEVSGHNRHDTYVAPKASMTLSNPFSCSCGVTLSYQYRDNQSNDDLSDYEGHRAALSIVRQF
jgi:hypothetical protein